MSRATKYHADDIMDTIWEMWSAGQVPGIRSVQARMGIKSASTAARSLKNLADGGEIVTPDETNAIWPIALLETVQQILKARYLAGFPKKHLLITVASYDDSVAAKVTIVPSNGWLAAMLRIVNSTVDLVNQLAERSK